MKKVWLILFVVFLVSCTNFGFDKVDLIQQKYNFTSLTPPATIGEINSAIFDLCKVNAELTNGDCGSGDKAVNQYIKYRVLRLSADKSYSLYMVDKRKRIDDGRFRCWDYDSIKEGVELRKNSSDKGMKSLELLKEFINKYPRKAKELGFNNKMLVFDRATFAKMVEDADNDLATFKEYCDNKPGITLVLNSNFNKTKE